MNSDEEALRDEICLWGRSMFERGLTPGSSGNLSARTADGYLVTPTGSCLGFLDPARLAKLDRAGNHVFGGSADQGGASASRLLRRTPGGGRRGSPAFGLCNRAFLSRRRRPVERLRPITPYAVMQLGPVPVLPYARPGSAEVGDLVRRAAPGHAAVLLANHGPVVSAASFRAAVFAAEELEATARLILLMHGLQARELSTEAIAELVRVYRSKE